MRAGATAARPAVPSLRVGGLALRLESHRVGTLAALALFLTVDVVYFGRALSDPSGSCACLSGHDPETYMWFLAYWPHTILAGHNPFLTQALFAPDQVNLGAVTLVPAAALIAAPVTLLLGPMVSYNLLALTAPVLAALAAFALCRYVTRRVWPSLLGGYLFGFSPYMLGHMMGHLDLVLVFPIPAIVLVALRHMDGQIGRRRCVTLLVLLLMTLYLSSPELTLTFVVVGGLVLGAALALAPERRGALLDLARVVLVSGAIAVAVLSVFIYYALTGDLTTEFFHTFPQFGGDALGLVVPTDVLRLGDAWTRSIAQSFIVGTPESGIYVGLPAALVVAGYGLTRWHAKATRILLTAFALAVVLLLGSHLMAEGRRVLPLPWHWLHHVPLLGRAIPVRFGVYLFLVVALLVAMWLAEPARRASKGLKWAMALLIFATMVPNVGKGYWFSRPSNPRFFTTDAYRHVIARDETVLALPWGNLGTSMLWQAETGFYFRMPEGYLGALLPTDYLRDPFLAPLLESATNFTPRQLLEFLARRRVGTVVVDAANPLFWPAALAAAGLHGTADRGVLVYQVPPGPRPSA